MQTGAAPEASAPGQQPAVALAAGRDGELGQQLAGAPVHRAGGVAGLVRVDPDHDHLPASASLTMGAGRRRTGLDQGTATLLSGHVDGPRRGDGRQVRCSEPQGRRHSSGQSGAASRLPRPGPPEPREPDPFSDKGTVASAMMLIDRVDVASRQGARLLRAGRVRPRRLLRGARAGPRHLGGPRGGGARARWRTPEDGALGDAARGPRSGERRARSPARRAGAGGNVAFDLTFAAPKSVSVLAAVGDERVRARGARRARRRRARRRSTTWSARPASCAAGATACGCFRRQGLRRRASTSTRWPARAIPTCTPTW